jgi:NADPH:quinone reductase-like Zn-dependent oxidoreductase
VDSIEFNRLKRIFAQCDPASKQEEGETPVKAVVLHAYGDVSELRYEDAEVPPVGAGEVRVRLHASSINPIDWKLRSGAAKNRFPLNLPAILGRDLAGEVDEAGPGVTGFPKGMRVMALANGCFAEYTTAKADSLAPIPEKLSDEQAAALPLVLLTGVQLIEQSAKVSRGQTILVTGALGSVGRVAVHVALQHGARVIAGVRASQKQEAASLAADSVVALDSPEEMGALRDLDCVADTVGGPVQQQAIQMLRDGGVYASVVGPPAEEPGRGIRVETMMAKPDSARLHALAEEVAQGKLLIPTAKVFPLSEIQDATRLAEAGGAGGKVVLVIE